MTADMTLDATTRTAALALGDDALVLSHRLGEWAGHAPVLEEEVALANIALDLLGQARVLLSMVGDEDELAYLREERAFRNLQLVEQPNGDFAHTIARQLYFSTYQHLLYAELAAGQGPFAPLAAKAVKEVAYHRDHAEQWTLRSVTAPRRAASGCGGRAGRCGGSPARCSSRWRASTSTGRPWRRPGSRP